MNKHSKSDKISDAENRKTDSKSNIPLSKTRKTIGIILAILFIVGVWLALDYKLLFGQDWISPTYDNPDWRTNEGNLHTFGAWDFETHVWKTEYLMQNFPNYQWNPYWYLGMPLLKYYQSGFYFLNILVIALSGMTAAKSTLMMIIFGHLLATILTFFVCYKVSRKIFVSALCSSFVLSNTFLSLRSYGWEPITVVFLFLFPLGLYIFFKNPLKPFRFWLILLLGIAYISHPLIWFSLCMTMGLYLLSIALRKKTDNVENANSAVDENRLKGPDRMKDSDNPNNIEDDILTRHYILQFIGIVILSLLIGALQFIPQLTYQQVTSGAHMGVSYLPFYQVATNIISLKDFFFDAGNLKGPGPVIMIAFFLLLIFTYIHYISRSRNKGSKTHDDTSNKTHDKKLHEDVMITGLTLTLFVMVLFYYMELYNIFPMNILRSIQYHRIIPEFVIIAAILVAALSNVVYTKKQKAIYYSMLIAFVAVSGIIIYSVQTHWETTSTISNSPEFIVDNFAGRISFPYTDQSLAVRNSFTQVPQVYGYYEQGITNPYADDIFSVSSGYHNAKLTILYLKAADVTRLYINTQEGDRDKIVFDRLNGTLPLIQTNNTRYAYFEIPVADPSFAQAVDMNAAFDVQKQEPGCRVMFMEKYCGSVKEEFVSTDTVMIKYLTAYVNLTDSSYSAKANMTMLDPNHYDISVKGAVSTTAIIVKMTHDKDFSASMNGIKIPITSIGPDFMLIAPQITGDYTIKLEYHNGGLVTVGLIISFLTVIILSIYFIAKNSKNKRRGKIKGKNAGINSDDDQRQRHLTERQLDHQIEHQKDHLTEHHLENQQGYLMIKRGDMK